jgi:hypothetical protein
MLGKITQLYEKKELLVLKLLADYVKRWTIWITAGIPLPSSPMIGYSIAPSRVGELSSLARKGPSQMEKLTALVEELLAHVRELPT